MGLAARASALAAVALLLPACNLTFTGDDPFADPAPNQNPFVLQVPLDGATGVFTTNTQFSWGPCPGATAYRIQISLTSSFAEVLYDDATLTTTFVTLNLPFTNETVYYWRVYGITGATQTLAGGSPARFKTVISRILSPGQFFLGLPTGPGVSRTPTFAWTASAEAMRYRLRVDTSNLFSAPVIDLPNLHWNQVTSPVTLAPSMTYYWTVTAVNNYAQTTSSPVSASFTTGP